MGAAAARFRLAFARSLDQRPVDLAVAIRRRDLAAVDEVLELLLVLVGMTVRLVAEHATLLDEVFERSVRPQRSRSSSCGERNAMPARRMANAATPSPSGGSRGA
jgi:hypothetical protein